MYATDPPLVLTHIPLLKVPAEAVNVHGHLHRAAGSTDRHVNVSAEHTDLRPRGTDVRPRACLQAPGTEPLGVSRLDGKEDEIPADAPPGVYFRRNLVGTLNK